VVLGVAYKPDVSDVRESPALDVIELLRQRGADVVYHDPHVPSIRVEGDTRMHTSEYSTELLQNADCVVIITNHSGYDWQEVVANSQLVIDTRHATTDYKGKARIVSL
jgi:UDP-N-acetyl-D-glucosamine dehydrogenase